MKSENVGYVRVSTFDQNEHRQLDGIELDKVFTDKASGQAQDRPGFKECMSYLREGDSLYVHSLDRLGRYVSDILSVVDTLNKRGVSVHFVKENFSFISSAEENPVTKLLFHVLASISEFERVRILERQKEGIEAAKKRGVRLGRKPALDNSEISKILERYSQGVSKAQLARDFGVSVPTIYRVLTPKKGVPKM